MNEARPLPLPSTVGEFRHRCMEMAFVLEEIDDIKEMDVSPLLSSLQQTQDQIVEDAGIDPECIPDLTELSETVLQFLATNEVIYREIIDRYAN